MKKYKTKAKWITAEIQTIECEKETDKCVWANGRRINKITDYERYHDSWEGARAFLLAKATNGIEAAQKQFHWAQRVHAEIRAMTKP